MKTDKLYTAAVRWWMSHRPGNMTFSRHLENPTINTKTESESFLAETIVETMKARLKKGTKARGKDRNQRSERRPAGGLRRRKGRRVLPKQ